MPESTKRVTKTKEEKEREMKRGGFEGGGDPLRLVTIVAATGVGATAYSSVGLDGTAVHAHLTEVEVGRDEGSVVDSLLRGRRAGVLGSGHVGVGTAVSAVVHAEHHVAGIAAHVGATQGHRSSASGELRTVGCAVVGRGRASHHAEHAAEHSPRALVNTTRHGDAGTRNVGHQEGNSLVAAIAVGRLLKGHHAAVLADDSSVVVLEKLGAHHEAVVGLTAMNPGVATHGGSHAASQIVHATIGNGSEAVGTDEVVETAGGVSNVESHLIAVVGHNGHTLIVAKGLGSLYEGEERDLVAVQIAGVGNHSLREGGDGSVGIDNQVAQHDVGVRDGVVGHHDAGQRATGDLHRSSHTGPKAHLGLQQVDRHRVEVSLDEGVLSVLVLRDVLKATVERTAKRLEEVHEVGHTHLRHTLTESAVRDALSLNFFGHDDAVFGLTKGEQAYRAGNGTGRKAHNFTHDEKRFKK